MKNFLAALALALVFSAIAVAMPFPTSLFPTNAQKSACPSGSPYYGPGNCVQNATIWVGLRAFSQADRGSPLIVLCLPADTQCETENSDATTGALALGTYGSTCNNSTVICTIKEWFDRVSGNDFVQTTIGARVVFAPNCTGRGHPCGYANGSDYYVSASAVTLIQPITFVAYAENISNTGYTATVIGSNWSAVAVIFGFGASADTAEIAVSLGLTVTASAPSGSFHALQGEANGGASIMSVDGVSTFGTTAANNLVNHNVDLFFYGTSSSNAPLTGYFTEGGIWGSVGFTATQISDMYGNISGYW